MLMQKAKQQMVVWTCPGGETVSSEICDEKVSLCCTPRFQVLLEIIICDSLEEGPHCNTVKLKAKWSGHLQRSMTNHTESKNSYHFNRNTTGNRRSSAKSSCKHQNVIWNTSPVQNIVSLPRLLTALPLFSGSQSLLVTEGVDVLIFSVKH